MNKLGFELIMWIVISGLVVAFNIYLRVYTKKTFHEIDEENIT